MTIPFIKMHGLGNDFVIVDVRDTAFRFTPEQIRRIADRRRGIGCDQFILVEYPKRNTAALNMGIYNADGSVAGSCGNATRCVADWEMGRRKRKDLLIETVQDLLKAEKKNGIIQVEMGAPRFEWHEVPLVSEKDTLNLDVGVGGLPPAVAVSMGNPHAVFFVEDVSRIDVAGLGAKIETLPLFPERANVEFAQVLDDKNIRMRVWERGAGITLACGSGACATLAAAVKRDLTGRKVTLHLDGGELQVEWPENKPIRMSGPVAYSFTGEISDALLDNS
jgi:diaminopimelate epimerase